MIFLNLTTDGSFNLLLENFKAHMKTRPVNTKKNSNEIYCTNAKPSCGQTVIASGMGKKSNITEMRRHQSRKNNEDRKAIFIKEIPAIVSTNII